MFKSLSLASLVAIAALALQPMMPAPYKMLGSSAEAQNYSQTSKEKYQQNQTSADRQYYSGTSRR